jgi:acetyl-CoA carboxylase carboxyltransferase component
LAASDAARDPQAWALHPEVVLRLSREIVRETTPYLRTRRAAQATIEELRRAFGAGMITALVRVEGRAFGLIANDPVYLSGAIEADGADKAARFMRLCDAYGLPLVALCDTPGFMVGPEIEQRAQVRHVSRMFVAGASLRVPLFVIVVRKGYGLGAMAMAGGGFHAPVFTAAWPTGEFGAMGLEGAVRLGFRRELDATADPAAREALYQRLVADAYENGKAINVASYFEIDAVIDPVETRAWIMRGVRAMPARTEAGERRGFIDTW